MNQPKNNINYVYKMVTNAILGFLVMEYIICVFNSCLNIIAKFNHWVTDSEKYFKIGLITSFYPFGALIGSYYCGLLSYVVKSTKR
jgi:hypothetical protein